MDATIAKVILKRFEINHPCSGFTSGCHLQRRVIIFWSAVNVHCNDRISRKQGEKIMLPNHLYEPYSLKILLVCVHLCVCVRMHQCIHQCMLRNISGQSTAFLKICFYIEFPMAYNILHILRPTVLHFTPLF